MLIIDENNKSINEVTLLLTQGEASELLDNLESILQSKIGSSHSHINDSNYAKEITICTYTPGEITDEGLDSRVKKHILSDHSK